MKVGLEGKALINAIMTKGSSGNDVQVCSQDLGKERKNRTNSRIIS